MQNLETSKERILSGVVYPENLEDRTEVLIIIERNSIGKLEGPILVRDLTAKKIKEMYGQGKYLKEKETFVMKNFNNLLLEEKSLDLLKKELSDSMVDKVLVLKVIKVEMFLKTIES